MTEPTPANQLPETQIDHSIDVRYESDLITMINKFIKKWCGKYYPHLIDDDENDGQFVREAIEDSLHSARLQRDTELFEVVKHIDAFFDSERERGDEEKRGLKRRDGGPTMMAFSLLNRIKSDVQKLLKKEEAQ